MQILLTVKLLFNGSIPALTEHTATKNFVLEHTKLLLNKNGFLSLRNLYKYFTLIELFNILKYKCPISINE